MKEGYEVYEAYVDGHDGEIDKGQPFVLEVRGLADYVRRVVRARIARSQEALPQGEPLWVRAYNDEKVTGPWAIEIVEELDEEEYQPVRADIARGEKPKVEDIY
ncbi:MAG TPA: hypothetical protein VJ256_01010 [Dehalococcoidia bacterium]|nr:hypothetical protein [Dehalococcoidia bacterium]